MIARVGCMTPIIHEIMGGMEHNFNCYLYIYKKYMLLA